MKKHVKNVKNSLIILDIDEIIIGCGPGLLSGSDRFFTDLRLEIMKKYPYMNSKKVSRYILPLFDENYNHCPITLVDNQWLRVFSEIKKKGFIVIGLTARSLDEIQKTQQQMKHFGIQFHAHLPNTILHVCSQNDIKIQNNIVFVGEDQSKGDAMLTLLKAGHLKNITSIFFIDDLKKNIQSVAASLKLFKSINLTVVRSTYVDTVLKHYDYNKNKNALFSFIIKNCEQLSVKKLLRKDPFTTEFVREQCTKPRMFNVSLCREKDFSMKKNHFSMRKIIIR